MFGVVGILTLLGAGCVAFLVLLTMIPASNPTTADNATAAAPAPPEAPASAVPVALWPRAGSLSGEDGAPLVRVPAGEFAMGAPDGDNMAWNDEQPLHRVYVAAFAVDKFEVTVGQYRKFLTATPTTHATCHATEPRNKDHTPPADEWNNSDWAAPQQPVVGVDWWDAVAYCQWAGRRLPTEAEWEKAARGTDARSFPWGSDRLGAFLRGNFGDEAGRRGLNDLKTCIPVYDDGFAVTAPVGSFRRGASPYEADDMLGNVWEWTSDWYAPDYYATSPARNPTGPKIGTERVTRGGAFLSAARYLRTSVRSPTKPAERANGIGFRCAVDLR